MIPFLKKGIPMKNSNFDGNLELESRITIDAITKDELIKILPELSIYKAENVQRLKDKGKTIDIYDSCTFRTKETLRKSMFIFNNLYPMEWFLSMESLLSPINNINDCDYDLVNVNFFLTVPIIKTTFYYNDYIQIKHFQMINGNDKISIEIEFDPTIETDPLIIQREISNFFNIVNNLIKNVSYLNLKYITPKNFVTPLKPLKNLPKSFLVSPKWNGISKKFKLFGNSIALIGKGFENTKIFKRKSDSFSKEYPLLHNLLSNNYLIVEDMNNFFVVIDLPFIKNLSVKIKCIQSLTNLFQKISLFFNIKVVGQIYLKNSNLLNVYKKFSTYSDGLILTTNFNQFKLKPIFKQTVDLLYLNGKYLTYEGILISEKVVENVKPVENYVYECLICINEHLPAFHRVNNVKKLSILNKCVIQQLNVRLDRGYKPNSFNSIVNYIESDFCNVFLNK